MNRVVHVGKLAAVVGGAAWTIKSLVIIAMNGHFQPLEGVLYFLGVGGILIGSFGLAGFVAMRWTDMRRWVAFVATLVMSVVVTSTASSFIQNWVADAYAGSNVGIEEEIGILTPGVIWLGVGVFLLIATSSGLRSVDV